jgi:mono/diheme cytochrome c family protein
LLLTWVALPLVPIETGLRFGMGYRVFFTAMVLLGALFFWFLGRERIPAPTRTAPVLASLAGVYLLTVGSLVAIGVVYPQFELPRPAEGVALNAEARGKELFWGENVGCFRCHAVGGTGGTRGPDLTNVALRAGERVSGLTAEQYLLEKVKAGMTYQFKVPEYAPMMPPFGQLLPEDQIEDLVAYLLSLK